MLRTPGQGCGIRIIFFNNDAVEIRAWVNPRNRENLGAAGIEAANGSGNPAASQSYY